jgi:hypothetical protein
VGIFSAGAITGAEIVGSVALVAGAITVTQVVSSVALDSGSGMVSHNTVSKKTNENAKFDVAVKDSSDFFECRIKDVRERTACEPNTKEDCIYDNPADDDIEKQDGILEHPVHQLDHGGCVLVNPMHPLDSSNSTFEHPSHQSAINNNIYELRSKKSGSLTEVEDGDVTKEVDKVEDTISREPKTIQDQMALEEAKQYGSTKGEVIFKELNDSKYKGMQKIEYQVMSKEGKKSVIHFVRDTDGNLMDFKFKKHSCD